MNNLARRILGGELLLKGYSVPDVADITDARLRTVYLWQQKIKKGGTESLSVTNHAGVSSKLTGEQTEELKSIIKLGALTYGFANKQWNFNHPSLSKKSFTLYIISSL